MSTPAVALSSEAHASPGESIARSLVDDVSALVSPPDVCLKVNELVGDDRSTIEDIAAVVIRDPALTARVLRLANSSYYALATKIDTVSRAVMLLGMREMQKLVCAIAAVQTFSKLSSAVTNMNSFWRHGVYTGLMAQTIARHAHILHPERLFVAGVLHDVGALLINQRFPELAQTMIREAAGNEDELHGLEQERLGFDHAYLAGLMLQHWKLPAALCDAISHHHAPHRARIAGIDAAILKLSDALANYSGTGSYSEIVAAEERCDVKFLARFGLELSCTNDQLMDEVDQQFVETIYLLVG
ncbi:MAG: HDOD domain-containing protein [Gammaproteobacteria bacterium]